MAHGCSYTNCNNKAKVMPVRKPRGISEMATLGWRDHSGTAAWIEGKGFVRPDQPRSEGLGEFYSRNLRLPLCYMRLHDPWLCKHGRFPGRGDTILAPTVVPLGATRLCPAVVSMFPCYLLYVVNRALPPLLIFLVTLQCYCTHLSHVSFARLAVTCFDNFPWYSLMLLYTLCLCKPRKAGHWNGAAVIFVGLAR